jgi:3-oxoacyl-[acyl-carrier-protein] synthase II
MTSGSSFFVLSKERNEQALAVVKDVATIGLVEDVQQNVGDFMADNALTIEDLDLILYAGKDNFPGNAVDYLALSGIYSTASAFALHYAVDVFQTDKKISNVLICNSLRKSNLGLMLVRAVEA